MKFSRFTIYFRVSPKSDDICIYRVFSFNLGSFNEVIGLLLDVDPGMFKVIDVWVPSKGITLYDE